MHYHRSNRHFVIHGIVCITEKMILQHALAHATKSEIESIQEYRKIEAISQSEKKQQ